MHVYGSPAGGIGATQSPRRVTHHINNFSNSKNLDPNHFPPVPTSYMHTTALRRARRKRHNHNPSSLAQWPPKLEATKSSGTASCHT